MSDAPALPASILSDPEYVYTYEKREQSAAAARKAQAAYRRLIAGFIVSTCVAAVVGGLVLYGADVAEAAGAGAAQDATLKAFAGWQPVQVTLRVIQALAVAAAAFCAFTLNASNYVTIWRENREKAERGRCERARVALQLGHARGQVDFKAAGDWVVADLMNGQICYLTKAINRHEGRAFRLTLFGGAVIAVAAGGPIVAAAGLPPLVLIGALAAVVTPALLSGFKSWGEVTGSSDRVTLHKATLDLLQDILRRRREFDQAIAANDLGQALVYVDEVCAALRTDVEGFLRIAGAAPVPPAPAAGAPGGSSKN